MDGNAPEPPERDPRSFERWAIVGCTALAVLAVAAFLVRRGFADGWRTEPPVPADRLLRVRLGGADRAPAPPPVRRNGTQPPATDDGSEAPRPPHDAPAPPPPATRHREVVVRAGETLGQIVQRELGTVRRVPEVAALNGLRNPDDLRAGQRLRLPVD